MTGWRVTGERLEGKGHGVLKILSWHVPGRTDKTTKPLSHISYKRHNFWKKNLLDIKYTFLFSLQIFFRNISNSTERI